jgi:hypothetical protein
LKTFSHQNFIKQVQKPFGKRFFLKQRFSFGSSFLFETKYLFFLQDREAVTKKFLFENNVPLEVSFWILKTKTLSICKAF